MWKYVRYILIIISYYVITKVSKFYNYIIIAFRNKARYYVYNYIISRDIFFIHKPLIVGAKESRIKTWLYFWFVWIWLNDDCDLDVIDSKQLPIIVKHNFKYRDHIYKLLHTFKTKPFTITSGPNNIFYNNIAIKFQNEYNFKYFYFYTVDSKLVFNIKLFNKHFGYEKTGILYRGKMVYKILT